MFLTPALSFEWSLLSRKPHVSRLSFSLLLKFLQIEGCFPEKKSNIPRLVIRFMAEQLGIEEEVFDRFRWNGRDHKIFPIHLIIKRLASILFASKSGIYLFEALCKKYPRCNDSKGCLTTNLLRPLLIS